MKDQKQKNFCSGFLFNQLFVIVTIKFYNAAESRRMFSISDFFA